MAFLVSFVLPSKGESGVFSISTEEGEIYFHKINFYNSRNCFVAIDIVIKSPLGSSEQALTKVDEKHHENQGNHGKVM